MSPDVLSSRALGRATLARQLLTERAEMAPLEAIEHLAGLQAQAPRPPYFGLWSRLAGFRPEQLSELLLDRRAVRAGVMRGTVHLVSARDFVQLRPLTKPVYERLVASELRRGQVAADPREVAAAGLELLRRGPLTSAELGEKLRGMWPGEDPYTLAKTAYRLAPVVQIPPRGVWGRSGRPTYDTVEHWLGRPVAVEPCVETYVLRYLGAFGPASAADAQTWSGLTRLGEVLERLRPQLRVFRDEAGRELFDLPEAPRPGPGLPVPARFVAEYDNLVLSHADRSRVVPEETRKRLASKNGQVPGTFLLDGTVRGTWKLTERGHGGSAVLTVSPFDWLTDAQEQELADEGERLLAFAVPGDRGRTVSFTAPPRT
ncbi:winged helix DNA-binding domain-containing protein [Streptomyces sp. ODS28]|uniref:winged helix DNA-binding domain-containing protein n=1 Tax=Streptomyces sp. ODS28 TaxID=3136688 RepID=UPI0031E7BC58